MTSKTSPVPVNVEVVFERYPAEVREALLSLRAAILAVAGEEQAGPVEETLKWGQPSYLVKSGTTIRIDRDDSHGGDVALYVNCRSSLVGEWRERFPDMRFGGTRSLHLPLDADMGDPRLRICIADALTYHKRKSKRTRD